MDHNKYIPGLSPACRPHLAARTVAEVLGIKHTPSHVTSDWHPSNPTAHVIRTGFTVEAVGHLHVAVHGPFEELERYLDTLLHVGYEAALNGNHIITRTSELDQ